jgi:DNA-binding LytR/AlgR family response regulator
MNNDSQHVKTITIKNRMTSKQIIVSDITHIICESYICDIYTLTDKFTTSKFLKKFESELKKFDFIRIHKYILINAKYICSIDTAKRTITLHPNIKVPFSVKRWEYIKSRLQNFNSMQTAKNLVPTE